MTRKKFTTALEEELIRQLKIKAIEQNTEPNKILEDLIKEYIAKEKEAH
jgi:hypothetical protein